jgi:hypothetical protein
MVAITRFFQKVSLDLVGFSASALCAIHCMVLPILIMAGTIGGFGLAHNHTLENIILALSAVIGLVSLVPAFINQHRKIFPLLIFAGGLTIILISRFIEGGFWEMITTTTGACLVATSHFVNWRYSRTACRF